MINIKKILLSILTILITVSLYSQEIEWKLKTKLPKAMRGTAISCNDKIYFMEANPKSSGVYEYNNESDTWKEKTQMITWGWNVNLAEINGLIYVIGGDPFRDRNELYDPIKNKWKTLAPMPTARQHTNCCVVNNKIYVIGGLEKGTLKDGDSWDDWAKKAKLSDKNEVYDPVSNKWESKAPLPTPRQGPGIGAIGNKIYAIGGAKTSAYDSPHSQVVEVYDIKQDIWERKSDFPIAVTAMGVISFNNTIYVIGGQTRDEEGNDVPISDVFYYDDKNDTWLKTKDLPNPIQVVTTTLLNESIYVIGGCGHNFKKLQEIWYTVGVD